MLTRQLPSDALEQHECIYNSAKDGASWQVFVSSVLNRGATLLILKTREGHILGGYADAPWLPVTDWYGDTANALFRCGRFSRSQETLPTNAWRATTANDHYQYLCWGKKSLPNGLAMGGQFGYCGLWLDQDFLHGHSKAGPLCTTYQSPALVSPEEFMLEEAEVWLVRPRPPGEDEDEAVGGGMFSRAENMEFMEMAGKKMYSKDLPNQPVQKTEEKSSE
ncbi:TLD-domain-containing protein [Syncephalastrum racemosum]|uniref:MTOR-associated protein MEAK7 n=1 Tax=Syncephalastrum racemosum TaxID=13706 RepID=A0A1X2HVP8_SYNRA|nr:TLD-domain-containing protein [Syncephalastrum racemosum]